MKTISVVAAACAASLATPAFACASCGCTLTSDWLSQGLVAQPGTTVTLRYDYVPQTELRSGTHKLGAISLPADREIERSTRNHYLTLGFDRQFSSDWGLNVQLPFVSRPHSTYDEDETEPSYSRTRGLGDVRVVGRWQGIKTVGSVTGLQFGVQLPTGRIGQTFRSGPTAGEEVDRGLQPGTGATQLIAGAYNYGRLAATVDYVLQAQATAPIATRRDYHPGKALTLSAGLHYTGWRGVTPQVELNFRTAEKDKGETSDRANSGGDTLYVAPGLSAYIAGGASAFAYVQLPLYQRVPGDQLTPKYTLTAGVQYRF